MQQHRSFYQIRLRRDGRGPLVFMGRRVAEFLGNDDCDETNSRWHDLAVYEQADGGFVVKIDYHSPAPSERPRHFVASLADALDVRLVLAEYDPLAGIDWRSMGELSRERRERISATICRRFFSQTADLWDAMIGHDRFLAEELPAI